MRLFPPTLAAFLVVALSAQAPQAKGTGCPGDMNSVEPPAGSALRTYCIDRYEASVVELTGNAERPHSPFASVKGLRVKAVSRAGVFPQAYISRNEAEGACAAAHKRLCTEDEWVTACKGRRPTTYPYGDERHEGQCNDNGKAPLGVVYSDLGTDAYSSFEAMNDPRLNQVPGSLARTGSHTRCRSGYGVFDMVGNVHEWVADPGGTFRGGYYLDTQKNGPGCEYRTVAHDATYHDYSTGFRCCASRK
jgi:formylglycine-generating enzyme